MKNLLFLFALLISASGAQGQIYVDSYRFGTAVTNDLLLDSFPTAALAISLRKLDKDYAGNCLTIQKDNGDTTNIGFSGDYLDTISVKNFCGTGAGDSCWVRTWFDQSGNNRILRQPTSATMPTIMISGTILTNEGFPIINFDGVNDFMEVQNSTSIFKFIHDGTSNTHLLVSHKNVDKNVNQVYGTNAFTGSDDGFSFDFRLTQALSFFTNRAIDNFYVVNTSANSILTTNEHCLVYMYVDADNATAADRCEIYVNNGNAIKNNISTGTVTLANSSKNFTVGGFTGYVRLNGGLKELIIYQSDMRANRVAMQNNINRFYSIY